MCPIRSEFFLWFGFTFFSFLFIGFGILVSLFRFPVSLMHLHEMPFLIFHLTFILLTVLQENFSPDLWLTLFPWSAGFWFNIQGL